MQHSSRCISGPLVLPTHSPRGETRPGGRGGLREAGAGSSAVLEHLFELGTVLSHSSL